MHADWASENLQVIRTLMERSALYRRALGPVMMSAGALGLAGAIIPCFYPIHSSAAFALYWSSIGAIALVLAALLVRSQALKAAEPFWSPPMRRVTAALMPPFLAGVAAPVFAAALFPQAGWVLAPVWVICYGCGLHAAGFFMRRGIRLFGLLLVGLGLVSLAILASPPLRTVESGHYVMGIAFGLAHLAFGVYLRFTEKTKTAA